MICTPDESGVVAGCVLCDCEDSLTHQVFRYPENTLNIFDANYTRINGISPTGKIYRCICMSFK